MLLYHSSYNLSLKPVQLKPLKIFKDNWFRNIKAAIIYGFYSCDRKIEIFIAFQIKFLARVVAFICTSDRL